LRKKRIGLPLREKGKAMNDMSMPQELRLRAMELASQFKPETPSELFNTTEEILEYAARGVSEPVEEIDGESLGSGLDINL
jgi:hypothetical protein